MPSNTVFDPRVSSDFDKAKMFFNAQGVSKTITAGTTDTLDYALTDDHLMTGLWVVTSGGAYGDKIDLQVIDTTGAYTGTAGTILKQFATNVFVPPEMSEQFDVAYPSKPFAGMSLRVVYHSTGATDVFCALNWKIHKVLA